MSLATRLRAQILFPLHERLKGHSSVAVRRRLELSQWWSGARIEAYQLERLRAFLSRIQQTVPFYRRRFAECGFDPATMRSVADMQRLPLLEKSDIRAHRDELVATGHGPLTRYNTGGSSGEPLVFFIGRDRKSHDVGAKWRATRWWGVDIGDPEIVLWGSPVELGAQDRVRQVRDRLLRSRLLPAFEMSRQRLDGFVAELRRFRPAMLFGYPSALALIAEHASAAGVRLDDLGIRVAFVTSERLYDHQRQVIGTAFGCRVANGYGGRDAGFIAHECPEGGLHISAEDIVVEIVDASGAQTPPGEDGEIVVTHLATTDFPFVRYRTGDVGATDPRACPCGRGLPMLKAVHGRTTDFVVSQSGVRMHGLAVIYVLREIEQVEQFKIVQESLSRTTVLVVPGNGYEPSVDERIRAGLRRRLGEGVTIDVQLVERIAPERSGKFRYVVSNVSAA